MRIRSRIAITTFVSVAIFVGIAMLAAKAPFPVAKKSAAPSVSPTREPNVLESFLTDAWIEPGKRVDLLRQYPADIFNIPGVASGTMRQFAFSAQPNTPCLNLKISWDSDIEIQYTVYDRAGRPIHFGHGRSGRASLPVFNSIYAIRIYYSGIIPKNARYYLTAEPLRACPAEAVGFQGKVVDIPRLQLNFATSMAEKFDYLRRTHKEMITNQGNRGVPIETLNEKIIAYLGNQGSAERSKIHITAAGVGDIRHFDEIRPSLSVRVVSGPAVFGTTRFKLYSIRTKEGLLDYVVGKLAEKDGMLVPQWRLVHLYIGERDAGVYLMEETPSSEFFWNLRRHESVVSSMGRTFYKPKTVSFNPVDADRLDAVVDGALHRQFARTTAFLSRFNATHGMAGSDFRFIIDPLSGGREPLMRDINVNLWAEDGLGVRSILTHGSWWLSPRFHGLGSHVNIKKRDITSYDLDCALCYSYKYDESALGLYDVHPSITEFGKNIANRTLVDHYLVYYASREYFDYFRRVLRAVYQGVENHLTSDEGSFRKFLVRQIEQPFVPGDTSIGRAVPAFVGKARVIVARQSRENDETTYIIYNLSPFTLRFAAGFPYRRHLTESHALTAGPSSLFPFLINHLYDSSDTHVTGRLTQRILHTVLRAETHDITTPSSGRPYYEGPKPYFVVKIPASEESSFRASLKRTSVFISASVRPMPSENVMFIEDFPKDEMVAYVPNRARNRDDLPLVPTHDALIFQQFGQYQIRNGYMLRYLVVNQSKRSVTLDFGNAIGKSFPGFEQPASERERLKLDAISARALSDEKTVYSTDQLTLFPSRESPVTQRTGLWIDNFVAMFNGPATPGKPVLGIVDMYFTFKGAGVIPNTYKMLARGYLGRYPDHIYKMLSDDFPKDLSVEVYEPAKIPFWPHNWEPPQKNSVTVTGSKISASSNYRETVSLKSGLYKDPIVVARHQTLIIPAGTRVEFSEEAGIMVYGAVRMEGTTAKPITLTARGESWKGVLIVNDEVSQSRSVIEHTTIEKAAGGLWKERKMYGGVSVVRARIEIRDVKLVNFSSGDAINFYHSYFDIVNLLVSNSKGDGLDSDWSVGRIVNSQFISCGGDCVDLSGSAVILRHTRILGAGDKGVSIGEGSTVYADNNQISHAKIGIALKDMSRVIGRDNGIHSSRFAGIVSYIRRPNYSAPVNSLHNTKITGSLGKTSIAEDFNRIAKQYD